LFRRILVEADSVDDALGKIRSQVPAGYEVLKTEVFSRAKADTITCSSATVEGAFGQARHKLPKGARSTEERELQQPGSETITVEAADESAAPL